MDLVEKYIPVFIDKAELQENKKSIRFYYFVVSHQTEKSFSLLLTKHHNCLVDLASNGLGKLVRSLSWYSSTNRFLLRASLAGKLFYHVNDVEKIFDIFHEHDFGMDTEYYTWPFGHDQGREMERGDVYRLHLETLLQINKGNRDITLSPENMVFSPQETEAFAEWNMQIIHKVKNQYHERPENNLRVRKGEK